MLAVTVSLWKKDRDRAAQQFQAEFNSHAQETQKIIERRIQVYKLILSGATGLLTASSDVTRSEFHSYVKTLELEKKYPGVKAIAFSPIIHEKDRKTHIAKIRNEGFRNYHLWPEGPHDITAAIVYREPMSDISQRLLGFNMSSNPTCREAMLRARDLNQPVLTRLHTQPHPTIAYDVQSVFVMFHPIYKHDAPLLSVDARRKNLVGWIHATFDVNSVLNGFPESLKNKIEIVLYDGDQAVEHARLTGTVPVSATEAPRSRQLVTIQQVEVAGHTWTMKLSSRPEMETEHASTEADIILIAGIISSGLMAFVIQLLIHGRERAFKLAQDMNTELTESEYRWKFALEGAREGVWDWNITTNALFVGPRFKRLLGYDEHEMQTLDWHRHVQNIHPEDRPTFLNAVRAYLEGTSPEFVVECRKKNKAGDWRWMLVRGMVVNRDATGKPSRMIGTLSDITERHKRNESLHLAATVFETMGEAVVVTDADNRIVSVNPAFTAITGYAPEEVIGQNPSMLSDGVERPELFAGMWQSLKTRGKWSGENVNRRKTGELYVAWLSVNVVRNARGDITNYVSAFSDISERKATEQRIQHLAHFDPLTDLPNRALFNDRLQQAIATCRRNRSRLAVLFVDLDKFKPVNDNLGHGIGDLLLKEVAYRMMDNIRESDTAARVGGDEFVILLSGLETESDAKMVAEKILSAIREPYLLDGHTIQISASIGIAVYPNHGHTDHVLLAHADEAMYHAKRGGGSAIASYGQIQPQNHG